MVQWQRSSGGRVGFMGQDDERDEAITEARISGTSSRALAKLHGCTSREVEAAVDRKLDYTLDNDMRMRAVKLDIARLEGLMAPFYQRAVEQKDVQAGTLCVKILERRALLLGLDQPVQSRIDVYQATAEAEPSSFERLHAMTMRIGQGRESSGNGNGSDPAADDGGD